MRANRGGWRPLAPGQRVPPKSSLPFGSARCCFHREPRGYEVDELTPERWGVVRRASCRAAAPGAAAQLTVAGYIKTLVNLHAGEVRLIGEWHWEPIEVGSIRPGPEIDSATGEEELKLLARDFRFRSGTHDYQYAKSWEVRKWLRWRASCNQEEYVGADVDWIFRREGAVPDACDDEHMIYENAMLRVEVPVTGGLAANPSDPEARWFIQSGKMLTLTDVFRGGHKRLSCLALYELWLSCPILIHRKGHSESNTPNAAKRHNAKRLRRELGGSWSLRGEWPDAAPGAEMPLIGNSSGSREWRTGWAAGWSYGWEAAWRSASSPWNEDARPPLHLRPRQDDPPPPPVDWRRTRPWQRGNMSAHSSEDDDGDDDGRAWGTGDAKARPAGPGNLRGSESRPLAGKQIPAPGG